jgi:hypothetical protein
MPLYCPWGVWLRTQSVAANASLLPMGVCLRTHHHHHHQHCKCLYCHGKFLSNHLKSPPSETLPKACFAMVVLSENYHHHHHSLMLHQQAHREKCEGKESTASTALKTNKTTKKCWFKCSYNVYVYLDPR